MVRCESDSLCAKSSRRPRARALILAACLLAGLMPAAQLSANEPPPEPAVAGDDIRQLMRLGGIDDARWADFRDGRPWTRPERQTLQKIMLRLAGLSEEDRQRLADPVLDGPRVTSDPNAARGRLYRLQGIVRSIVLEPLSPELTRRFELKRYYRVEMDLNKTKRPVVVFTRSVPAAWRQGGRVDEPGAAWGMFVKLSAADTGEPRPVFAAARLSVYPRDRLLGELGVDVGLLDTLADRRPLGRHERECFYQVLAAAGRAAPGQLAQTARERLAREGRKRDPVEPLFNDPAAQRGKLVLLSGTARRVLRVRVDDPDIRRRFGIDHYYEIYLYTGDSQGNPLVFCVTQLPEDLPTGDGPKYSQPLTVAGFFLKSWAYASGRADEPTEDGRTAPLQLAPLLIGREADRPADSRPAGKAIWGAVGSAAFVLFLLVVWVWLVRQSRVDRRLTRPLPTRLYMAGTRLDEMDDEADRKPDFKGIDSDG